MKIYILLIILFNILKISALKIKLGKNFNSYLTIYWEKNIEDNHIKTEKDGKVIGEESLFILAELVKNNENIYYLKQYRDNNGIYYNNEIDNLTGDFDEIDFNIDFTNENPQYKMNFSKDNITLIKDPKNPTKNIRNVVNTVENIDNEDILKEKTKIFLENKKDPIIGFDEKKKIIKDLVKTGIEEKNKKWALFKIKLLDQDEKIIETYFYCNDIESFENKAGIFQRRILYLKVIKSNAIDIKSLSNLCSQCKYLEYVDLTNLKTTNMLDISYMFASCGDIKNLIFPKDIKIRTMELLFFDCKSLENSNFSELEIKDLKNMNFILDCSKIKKIKFPKIIIKKDTEVYSDEIYNGISKKIGFLANNKLEEVDLSNFEFERGSGKYMFYNTELEKVILPANMKNLSEEELKDIFCNHKIKCIQIGDKILQDIEEFDLIHIFIREPEQYIKGRETIKKLYNYNKSTESDKKMTDDVKIEDIPKVDGNCFLCCAKCCICCNQR